METIQPFYTNETISDNVSLIQSRLPSTDLAHLCKHPFNFPNYCAHSSLDITGLLCHLHSIFVLVENISLDVNI